MTESLKKDNVLTLLIKNLDEHVQIKPDQNATISETENWQKLYEYKLNAISNIAENLPDEKAFSFCEESAKKFLETVTERMSREKTFKTMADLGGMTECFKPEFDRNTLKEPSKMEMVKRFFLIVEKDLEALSLPENELIDKYIENFGKHYRELETSIKEDEEFHEKMSHLRETMSTLRDKLSVEEITA